MIEKIDRPWLSLQPPIENGLSPFAPRFRDGLSLFKNAVQVAGDRPAVHYFDGTLSYSDLDRLSDAFARHLHQRGIQAGDRVALYLQNIPQYVICLVGAWKAGAIGVSVNPMNRARELRILLQDSGANVLVLQRDLHIEVARAVLREMPDVQAITTAVREYQSRNDPIVLTGEPCPQCDDTVDLVQILATGGIAPSPVEANPDDPAMIVYTSGTTGVPKGAVITHANFAIDAELWRAWVGVRDGAPILAIAPLFHITGLVGHVGFAFALAAPLILSMRFHPAVAARAAQEHRAEFVVGAITAFIAMMNDPEVRPEHLASLVRVYSGGAPVPATVARAFEQRFGVPIRNCYGLTESSSLAVGVPPTADTPIDLGGAYSIGIPVFETDVVIADEAGQAVPHGTVGEILIRGPQVLSGYWARPKETEEALADGFLRTGDVGYMDAKGWLFIVDRKKDMISASGYKVWPKEVEEVIYTHPAVREVAVVGVPDGYRGETVKAVVSLKDGYSLTQGELTAFCKERMAAYKYPRLVEFVPELPKTLTGKILRRALR
jgi:long-chain acyl-CoA synthetase